MGPHETCILIIGLGNPIMNDDGVGAAVIAELERVKWPAGVVVMDAGISAVSCLYEISHARNLIAVDAVRAGGLPGSVYRLTIADDVRPHADSGQSSIVPRLNWSGQGSHGLPLPSVVALSRSLTGMPMGVVVYGVEPENLEFGMVLSGAVKEAIPKVAREIEKDVRRIIGK